MPVGFGKEWVITAEEIDNTGDKSADTACIKTADDYGPEDYESEYTESEDESGRKPGLDIRAAREKALWLLSRQDYSVKCMREKLLDKGASPEDTDKVIEYLRGLSYLDDERFARSYVRTHSSISRQSLKQKLFLKGIDSETGDNAIEECYTGDPSELISQLARKRHFDPEEADYDSICKFKAYLYRRGFQSSEIRAFFSGCVDH
ncbi:MAG: recombination regulator RecX [Lachnospiraceae bacterium]|nr:recombination regulator RecX [Lachnospiraceae bacterium]